MTTPQVHPLQLPGAITAVVRMIGGKQIREVLPEVKAAMDSVENDMVADVLAQMDATAPTVDGGGEG